MINARLWTRSVCEASQYIHTKLPQPYEVSERALSVAVASTMHAARWSALTALGAVGDSCGQIRAMNARVCELKGGGPLGPMQVLVVEPRSRFRRSILGLRKRGYAFLKIHVPYTHTTSLAQQPRAGLRVDTAVTGYVSRIAVCMTGLARNHRASPPFPQYAPDAC